MEKIILLTILFIVNIQAGWMNVDSINIKQKWRNKKLNTDALLYIRASDSLLDTANIYDKSGLIGINTSSPIDELTVGGALYLDGDAPQVYDPAWHGWLISEANLGQMSGWKMEVGGGFSAIPNLAFVPATDSLASGNDPRTLTYGSELMTLSGEYRTVRIGSGSPDPDWDLYVNGDAYIADSSFFMEYADFDDVVHVRNYTEVGVPTFNPMVYDATIISALSADERGRISTANTYSGGVISPIRNGSIVVQPASDDSGKSINFVGGTGGKQTFQVYDTTITNIFTDSVNISGNLHVAGNLDATLTIPDPLSIGSLYASDSIYNAGGAYLQGNTSIGTDIAEGKLHVYKGSAGIVTANTFSNAVVIESDVESGISLLTPDNISSNIFFGTPTDNAGAVLKWNHNNDLFSIGTANSGAEVSITSANGTEAIRIGSNQYIGINDPTPDARLHVNGDTKISGTLDIWNADYTDGTILFGADGGATTRTDLTNKYGFLVTPSYNNTEEPVLSIFPVNQSATNDLRIGGGSGAYNCMSRIQWYTGNINTLGGTQRMVLDSLGNFGINVSTPSALLDVNGTSELNGNIDINGNVALGENFLGYDSLGVNGLNFNSSGRLQVMNTALLNGDNRRTLKLYDNTSYGEGVGAGITFYGKYNSSDAFGVLAGINAYKSNPTDGNYDGQLHLQTRANGSLPATVMVLDEDGNTGIGTTSPDEKLTIANGGDTTKISGIQYNTKTVTAISLLYNGQTDGPTIFPYNPGSTTFNGVQFSGTTDTNNLYGSISFPSEMKKDTIWPFIQIAPQSSNSGNIKFHLYYKVYSPSVAVDSEDSVLVTFAANGTTAFLIEDQFFSGIPITSSSRGIVFRLFRDPADAADTFTEPIYMETIGIEYKVNRIGSLTSLH